MSSPQRFATVGLVILAAGGAGFLIYKLSAASGNESSFEDRINAAASAATGPTRGTASTPAAAFSASASDDDRSAAADASHEPNPSAAPAAPKQLPTLSLPDLDGKPRALSEWHGRPLLINFWATWCEPCRREIPLLRQLRAEHSKFGLEVLGIAVDFHDAVKGYAKQAGIDYPVLVAEEDATAPKAFGVGMGLPTTVFADREGRIVATHIGELHADEAEKLVARALGKP